MPLLSHIRRAIRRPFEAAGYTLLQWIIPLFPRFIVVGTAKLAGKLAWTFARREREFGLKNLNAIFGDTKTAAEKKFILTTSFSTFCLTMLDLFWFAKNTKKRMKKYVHFAEGFDSILQPKSNLIITAHLGNWEVLGTAITLHGIHLSSIAATVKNRRVDQTLCRLRAKMGQVIIPQKGALRTLIARLRNQETVAFVLDQNTDASDGGITIDFLGFPMSVSSAPALLAYRTHTKISFAFCKPQPHGNYLLYSLAPLQPPTFDKENDRDLIIKNLTQEIQNRISEEIHAHPEFWLWAYKHWRRIPEKNYPSNHPDY